MLDVQSQGGPPRVYLQVRLRVLWEASLRGGASVRVQLPGSVAGEVGEGKPNDSVRKGEQDLIG